eukprot:c47193_g1_i1.p1 GENE.c47193_g1_i1~~c47193_g1_i1.p1  ORF type:complete len:364 (-),score=63.80 c47193_g1_i1:5-964(-)
MAVDFIAELGRMRPAGIRQALLQAQPQCINQDSVVGSIATDRGYLNIRDCSYLVAKLKSQGESCDSPLYIFGMPEDKLSSLCCQSCAQSCQDHDSVIHEIMTSKLSPEHDTCDKAVIHLKDVNLDRNSKLNQYGFHNLTIADICCVSIQTLKWREPLPVVGPKKQPPKKEPPSYHPKAPTDQFKNAVAPNPEEVKQMKMEQTVQAVRHDKRLKVLEARMDRLHNRTVEIGETIAPNITVGNKTLTEPETAQYGQGYANGFFQGYKTGFLRAEADDLDASPGQTIVIDDYLQARPLIADTEEQPSTHLPPLYSEKERNKL